MFKNRTDFQIAVGSLLGKLPESIGRFLLSSAIGRANRHERFMSVSNEMATSIVIREKEAARLGTSRSKDLLSILSKGFCLHPCRLIFNRLPVRANASEDPKNRLNDDEILSQLK